MPPAAVSAVLEVSGLVKDYRRGRAVDGVDLRVCSGERVAILGANGAGKTTTLLMILGAVTPDAGTITVAGHRLPKGRSDAMSKVGFSAGYMPLAERLKVREFLRLYANIYGIRHADGVIAETLERFRIGHLAGAMSTELSSGQRTLVGIVKALLHRPVLLVLDEPTASLDPDVAQRVREGLIGVNRDWGTALLVTSHNMVEVERLCERIVFLAGGRVVADGTAQEVAGRFGHGDLESVFLHLAGGGA